MFSFETAVNSCSDMGIPAFRNNMLDLPSSLKSLEYRASILRAKMTSALLNTDDYTQLWPRGLSHMFKGSLQCPREQQGIFYAIQLLVK
jgi:hypothetical protein